LREMFEEPAAFFEPPPPPGSASYRRPSNGQLVQLVTAGRSPLWGHIVWNAGRVMADYIEGNPAIVLGKSVLELGAGAALPAIVAALNGAKCVTITDYPDGDLVESMTQNVAQNISPSSNCVVHVRGYKVCHKF
jgi:nicotinamide N-methyltransferase